MHGSGKLPWGRGLCTVCDQCRATSSLSHPITGWTLTRLTDAGQSSFCSLAATVSHVARERWLEVFWILLIGSRHRNAHWDLWNGTIESIWLINSKRSRLLACISLVQIHEMHTCTPVYAKWWIMYLYKPIIIYMAPIVSYFGIYIYISVLAKSIRIIW